MELDANLNNLVEAMVNACLFAEQAEMLAALSKHHLIIANRILQQVIECTYFINAYCKNASFGTFCVFSMLHLHKADDQLRIRNESREERRL